jgi:hypothetical protein
LKVKLTVSATIPALILAFSAGSVFAQADEDFEVVLPDEAQVCVLPVAPDAIPDEATYDDLVAAKGQIAEFQGSVETYRSCLKGAEDLEDNTAGNKQAIIASFNYSVDMEERVAERFNEAVRSYKERKAES